jgi:hypothetical protein
MNSKKKKKNKFPKRKKKNQVTVMMSFRLKTIQVIRLLQSSLSKVKLKLLPPNSSKCHPKKMSNLFKV